MSFIDHLEALRWHIARSVIVWLVALVLVFIKIDWVFDKIIMAPSNPKFITYKWFCDLSHFLRLGDTLCMPPVELRLLGTTVSGPFMSAISIAMISALVIAFPYFIFELWRFIKPALSPKELRYSRGSIFWVSLCFFTGAAFGYFILAPFTFNFLANFNLLYTHKWFAFSVNGLYKARQPQGALSPAIAVVSDEYFIVNAKSEIFLWQNKLSAFAEVDNITDTDYTDILGSQMPGRWFMAGIKISLSK